MYTDKQRLVEVEVFSCTSDQVIIPRLTDGFTDGLTDGLTVGLTDGLKDGLKDGLTDGFTVGLTDGLTVGLTDGLTMVDVEYSAAAQTSHIDAEVDR